MLVKGLDFALLEQTRARVAAETAATEDVSLEEAYMESVAQPKKRTREEILRELKSKRGAPGAQHDAAAAVPAAADACAGGAHAGAGAAPAARLGRVVDVVAPQRAPRTAAARGVRAVAPSLAR